MGGGSESSARPTIVIVDDAVDVRALVRARFRLSGRLDVVAEGSNGAEAVAAVREHRPDLLLLDVSMPGMDGLEALPRVLEASPTTRVVMYSGFQEEGLANRARELGAMAFLEKSAALETLDQQLIAFLDQQPAPDPSSAPVSDDADPLPDIEAAEEAVLNEHLERFREVFDDAAIGMATVTLAGQVVRANRALADLLHQDIDRLVGRAYADFTAGAGDQVAAALDELLRGDSRVVQLEHDVLRVAPARQVRATFAPVLDSADRPLYLFLQVQDVTAQRGAEEELRRSEARFRLLVENVEDYAIFMLSPDGFVESWNAGAERIKGYREEEIVGQHFRVFYPRELQESRHPEHELLVALRDGHYEEEGWRIRSDGRRFWANVLITAVHDQDGRHIGFAKVTRDITEKRARDLALRESEERFRLLVEAVGDYAIFMLSPEGMVQSWNVGAERSNGYAAEDIIGRHFRVFYPPEQQAARHPEHELEIALREGRYEEEGWRLRQDGTRFWANVVITAVRDERGELVGFAKVTRDTTERRAMLVERERAAAELADANAQLQQAAEDQAHFLAVTAHELRTPVGVLGGTADMLAAHWSELEEEERRQLLEGMGASSQRLRRLVADLLTASRLQASALHLSVARVDVRDLLEVAAATARRTNPGAVVEVYCEEDVVVSGDRDRLAQAVDNLIGNALRHGVPPVEVHARAVGEDIEIAVQDAGPGVSDEMRPRLFERFATGHGLGGTGLGLYIVRQLARSHGGDASYRPGVAGQPGAFVITLPRTAMRAPATSGY